MKGYLNSLKILLCQNSIFLTVVFTSLLIVWLAIFQFSNTDLFLIVNANNTIALDYLFYGITYLGDGLFSVGIILVLLFLNRKQGILYFSIFIFSGAVAQILKFTFSYIPRPAKVLESSISQLHWVLNSPVQHWHSFPSGHTITSFSLAFFISKTFNNKWLQCLWAVLALSVAYSRVYLFQHFPIDVIVGAIIGLLCAWFIMAIPKFWPIPTNF
jgi:membrane-associated phospholipid phosphatase